MASSASASATAAPAAPAGFDIMQLPSIKQGMSAKEESIKRVKTCRFMEEACRCLRLPQVAKATAMVFFHRFYAKHSFQEHDRFEVAVASLVLAAKVEESPKKLDKVIQECVALKHRAQQAGRLSQQIGSTSPSPVSPPSSSSTGVLDLKGEEFKKLKERILLLERIHLHTIGFDLFIEHPYKFSVEQIKKLVATRKLKYTNEMASAKQVPARELIQKMSNELIQYSISFANDSMQTSLCLQFSPQQISTACVLLACQYANVEPTGGPQEWMEALGNPNLESLVSICTQIMDLIGEKKASDGTKLKRIRAMLDVWQSGGNATVGPTPVLSSSSTTEAAAGTTTGGGTNPPPPSPEGSSPKRQRLD